ncbi:MAG TPA: 2-amino-4-hydroxy-6-hydroxymethyldihydropteridine diphosphokinase [Allosphingosinicella sp.]|jgi:2-amino-4-hydroxy-6-hydroxymethyldihydropteridine diphosphokinase
MALTSYAIALGSNRRSRHGSPARTLRAAADALGVEQLSTIRSTPAVGPAGRGFANAAALLASDLDPPELLDRLKALERAFGRRPGRRWGPRVLDLDIILWSGGSWGENGLIVPHPEYRRRAFVLEPLAEIAPAWRDPLTGATIRQLLHRLRRSRPPEPLVDPAPARS